MRAVTHYLGRDGKLFEFEIVASDANGVAGRARRIRAVVDAEQLQDNTSRRVAEATISL